MFLSNAEQGTALISACNLQVTARDDDLELEVNVFDSANPTEGDEDLGSPNETCEPAGDGVGSGGEKDSEFENCVPQGNLLIIQETSGNPPPPQGTPNDRGTGGCIKFDFETIEGVELANMGLLDFDNAENPAVIKVFQGDTVALEFFAANAG